MHASENNESVATDLAQYAKTYRPSAQRGSVSLPIGTDRSIVGAFAHDNYVGDQRSRREVNLLRCALSAVGVDEVGFGVSKDGGSWALVVDSSEPPDRLQLFLEEAVTEAWHIASCTGEFEAEARTTSQPS
jgi:hypothetical protein